MVLLPILEFTLWASFNPSGLFFGLCNTVLSFLMCFTNAEDSAQLAPKEQEEGIVGRSARRPESTMVRSDVS